MGEPTESQPSRGTRLAEAIRLLRARGGMNERWLMVAGGALLPVGVLAVLIGWWGASHTPNLYEQVPYLISGGLLGVGLIVMGGFLYFAHWLTEMLRQGRRDTLELLAAIERLGTQSEVGGRATANGSLGPVRLVATARGNLYHRPSCSVVAGKSALRAVGPDDGLQPCRLCDPHTIDG